MANKIYKPTTPGRRLATGDAFDDITAVRPYKPLTSPLKRTGGRNAQGRISVQHRGGGHKQRYRLVDSRSELLDIPAKVETIEYDPNRSARIALVRYEGGERRYMLAPGELHVGDTVITSSHAVEIKVGNRLPLKYIPSGILVSNVELIPQRGGVLARSAGMSTQVLAKEGDWVTLKLPSGEMRKVLGACLATVGQMSFPGHRAVRLGKAGRARWLGRKPTVRGKAKNPVDHPHGGGEGGHPIGLVHPKTPWGKPALGIPTRKKHKKSNKFILSTRKGEKVDSL